MAGGAAFGGDRGKADHGLAPDDFRHSGLKLEWGHEHSPDAFEVFAIAASRDGTKIVAGGASPVTPGTAHVRVWRIGQGGGGGDDGRYAWHKGGASSAAAAAAADDAASASSACVEAKLMAEGAVAALSVALSSSGDAVFAGMADGTLWAWNLPSGALRYGPEHEHHPTLAKLPRRRRPHRNPFVSIFTPNNHPDPRPIRRLVALPLPRSPSSAASPPTLLMGSIGHHGVFPVWDGDTGDAPRGFGPSAYADHEPAYHEDGLCHVAVSADGTTVYTTSVDAKGLRAWDTGVYGYYGDEGGAWAESNGGGGGGGVGSTGAGVGGGDGGGRGGKGRCVWRSERLVVRNVYLAGLAILPRPDQEASGSSSKRGKGGGPPPPLPLPLLATCAASLVTGTCYAEPDSPVKIVLVDGGDGREVRRYTLEGVTACNRFIDCSSLTAGGGGTLLFLAHKDGSIWVHSASNGAQIAALHGHSTWAGTSGHHRLLPACVAAGGGAGGEFLYSATTDGQCVHRWQVGPPLTWTRRSHARFPRGFRDAVRELVVALHVHNLRDGDGGGGGGGDGSRIRGCGGGASVLAAGPTVDGEVDEGGSKSPALWGAGFAEVVAVEPAILELVVGRMARLAYGCRTEDEREGGGGGGWWTTAGTVTMRDDRDDDN